MLVCAIGDIKMVKNYEFRLKIRLNSILSLRNLNHKNVLFFVRNNTTPNRGLV